MRWLGRVDRTGALFDPLGLPGGTRIGSVAGNLLPRGTLLIEAQLPAGREPVIVLDHHVTMPWRAGLRIETTPDGGLHLTVGLFDGHQVLLHNGLESQEVRSKSLQQILMPLGRAEERDERRQEGVRDPKSGQVVPPGG